MVLEVGFRLRLRPSRSALDKRRHVNALKLTKHAGSFEGALSAPSSLSRASQLSAVLSLRGVNGVPDHRA